MENEGEEPIATTAAPREIKTIDKKTVHHICSNQVIINLGVAIKELVENSLDSGATRIDIKLVDHGKTSITVTDNGSGVLLDDFEGLCLKHHTSKLREFDDLPGVSTFGFRGEALSSLCAISKLTVITKHPKNDHAYKLYFDKNGVLEKKEQCAREVGTTICIKDIFKDIPVRAREFKDHIKKEYTEAIDILHGYCLVSNNVKISCSNTVGSKSSVIFATSGNTNTVLDNAICIFGKKALTGVEKVELIQPPDNILEEFRLPKNLEINFTWEFYITNSEHKLGRSAPDRQFFYVNGRPCNFDKCARFINNLYHKFNVKKYPFIFLNLKILQNFADVNVTPDKRTIFVTQLNSILATLKTSLLNVWEKSQGVFSTQQTLDELQTSLKRSFTHSNSSDPPAKKIFRTCSEGSKDLEKSEESKSETFQFKKNQSVVLSKLPDSEWKISIDSIRKSIENNTTKTKNGSRSSEDDKIKFRPGIKFAEAEKEMKKQLMKDSFAKMKIIGQYNVGFIVTHLDDELFVVDQHASDEKFNFEKFTNEEKLETQKLVIPKPLQLTAVNESIVIDNRKLFEANGFSLDIQLDNQFGERVRLAGLPVSENKQFGVEDLEELIFLIKEGGLEKAGEKVSERKILRPTKVRDVLAMKACRRAVMIGVALNKSEMKRIVSQLSGMHNPWNCPHGRPTIMHLLSLNLLRNKQ